MSIGAPRNRSDALPMDARTSSNDRSRPRRRFRAGALLFAMVALTATCQPQTPSRAGDVGGEELRTDLAAMEREVEKLVNDARREDGLPPLARSDALAKIARAHSQDMAKNDYLGHEDQRGHGPEWRVQQAGIEYRRLAENVAENQGYQDPSAQAVEGWLQSSGHRRNILDRGLARSGIGIALDRDSRTYYFTQLFMYP